MFSDTIVVVDVVVVGVTAAAVVVVDGTEVVAAATVEVVFGKPSLQSTPSPMNPSAHVQVNEPYVFWQLASGLHGLTSFVVHSLMSEQDRPLPLQPGSQMHSYDGTRLLQVAN
jgi:hypothetical protein